MNNLLRFTGIVIVLIVASMLILAVAGVLSSSELWKNLVKVAELTAILVVASAAVMLLAKK
jgi:hypothetical protein